MDAGVEDKILTIHLHMYDTPQFANR